MNIHVHVIPHKQQRYDTCGDWFWDANNHLHIKVSECTDARYEQLVAIHEIVEAVLCDTAGIDENAVTDWDIKFTGEGEPGDDPKAPYHKQHRIATAIETLLAAELGVNWQEYEKELNELQR